MALRIARLAAARHERVHCTRSRGAVVARGLGGGEERLQDADTARQLDRLALALREQREDAVRDPIGARPSLGIGSALDDGQELPFERIEQSEHQRSIAEHVGSA